MKTIKILLCCGAGMSSGFLANNVRKAIKKQKVNATVEARSYSEVTEYMSSIDVLMIGPHFATELHNFEAKAEPYGVKVAVIPKAIYGSLDGAGLLNYILDNFKEIV